MSSIGLVMLTVWTGHRLCFLEAHNLGKGGAHLSCNRAVVKVVSKKMHSARRLGEDFREVISPSLISVSGFLPREKEGETGRE